MMGMKLFKSEFVKFNGWICLLAAVLLPVVTVVIMKTQLISRMEGYIDIPIETYTFSLLCNTYLFFLFPCLMLLFNIYFSIIESKENGWMLVLVNAKRFEYVMYAKCVVNIMICLVSYLSITCISCYLLRERGFGLLFDVVIIPMFESFLCFLPIVIVIQMACIFFPHVIEKVFLGVFLILVNVFVTQTKYGKYVISSFYITIVQDTSFAGLKIGINIVTAAAVLYAGTKISKKLIQAFRI